MYHEEKIIDGVLHYRGLPQAAFVPYDLKELSERHVKLQAEILTLRIALREAASAMRRMEDAIAKRLKLL